MANLLWIPGPWGPDLGRYAEDIAKDEAPKAPPTGKSKSKAKSQAKTATLNPSAEPPKNDSPEPGSGSAGADA